jgi:hypothetical protein
MSNLPWRDILRRRWRPLLLTSLAVLTFLLLTWSPARPLHRIELRYIVGTEPLPSTTRVEEERYYRWVGSEYEVYALADWVNGSAFIATVRDELEQQGFDVDPITLEQNVYAEAVRSRLLVGIVYDDLALVESAAAIMDRLIIQREGLEIPQFSFSPVQIFPIDVPEPDIFNPPVSRQLSLPVRLLLGVLSGFVVVFLLELFDPVIRYRKTLDDLQLPLLGEIPGER